MNYKHIYHAGNFADVAKHVALQFCLTALARKESAFFALDTHAGRGFYELGSAQAQKSGEAAGGVQRLTDAAGAAPGLEDYLRAVGAEAGRRLARYPGSPALIARALRAQDRALFVELDPGEARALERELTAAGRFRIEAGDGYAALKAHLPPRERRGLVLIDPPYESADELKTLLRAFADAYRRWSGGTYLIWYPILSGVQRAAVHGRFRALKIPKILSADLAVHPDDAGIGLAGSGLLIVNPPFGADQFLRNAYRALHGILAAEGRGYAEVARITPEQMAQ